MDSWLRTVPSALAILGLGGFCGSAIGADRRVFGSDELAHRHMKVGSLARLDVGSQFGNLFGGPNDSFADAAGFAMDFAAWYADTQVFVAGWRAGKA